MDKKGCKKKRGNCDKESNCKLAKLDSNSEEIDKSLKQFVEYQEHLNRLYENLSSVVKKPPPQSSYIIEMPSQIVSQSASQSPPVRFISPGIVPTLPQNQPLVQGQPQTQLVVARYGSKRKCRRSKAHKKAHKKTHKKRRSKTKK